jgi:hypothetical protein
LPPCQSLLFTCLHHHCLLHRAIPWSHPRPPASSHHLPILPIGPALLPATAAFPSAQSCLDLLSAPPHRQAAKIHRYATVACHHAGAFSLDAVVAIACFVVPSPGRTRHCLLHCVIPQSRSLARLHFPVSSSSNRRSPPSTFRRLRPTILLLRHWRCCIFGSATGFSIPCSTIFCVAPSSVAASRRTVPNQTGNIMF